ncbi:MAG: AMP-binding protein [Gemmatimonadota bacterium]
MNATTGATTPVLPIVLPTVLTPLVQHFVTRAREYPDAVAYVVYPRGAAEPADTLSWGALHDLARALAARLIARGVVSGDRVLVHGGNRPMWPVADLALQMIGAVGVGVYPSSAPAQVRAIAADSTPVLALADSSAGQALLQDACTATGGGFQVVGHDDPAHPDAWQAWCRGGKRMIESSPSISSEIDARIASTSMDAIAALIYTSGSTGEPKGAALSHRYLAASAESIKLALGLHEGDSGISFLPFSHAAERVFGQCTRLRVGMSAALVEDPSDVFRVAQSFEPTLFGGLPRVFERIHEAAALARSAGTDPRLAVTSRIGTRCRLATSGGATLPTGIAHDLAALGLEVLGAYGQTEHLCIAMNRPGESHPDTVGPAMPGTELRIADDGEVQVRRSALTFAGYAGKPADTAAAFTPDGTWLRTGDRGLIDAQGRLRITGRVKDLIALSNGRKIAPAPIEAALAATPFIAQAVCHGEGAKFLVALLSLRRAVVEAWARTEGLSDTWPVLVHNPKLQTALQAAIDHVNSTLARTDQIKAFSTTDVEFTTESGLLTPTLKVVRSVAAARFETVFNRLHLS